MRSLIVIWIWPDALVRRRWQRLVSLVMAATPAFMIFECGRTFVPSSVFAHLQASHRPGFLKVSDDYCQTHLFVAACFEFTSHHSADEAVVGYSHKVLLDPHFAPNYEFAV